MRGLPGLPPRLPAGVADALGVRPGEKVIAWGAGPGADVTQAAFVVATTRALYTQATGERVPWHRVSKAAWDEPILDLVLLDDGGQPSRPLRIRLDDAKDLPPAVHDRVTDSVLISDRVELGAGAGALLVARRDSDDGSIRWAVVFDAGLDPADPQLRAAVDEALGRLRESLGI